MRQDDLLDNLEPNKPVVVLVFLLVFFDRCFDGRVTCCSQRAAYRSLPPATYTVTNLLFRLARRRFFRRFEDSPNGVEDRLRY